MRNAHHINIDHAVNVPVIILVIHMLNVNRYQMIIVTMIMHVHWVKFVMVIVVSLDVVMMVIVNSKKHVSVKFVKIRAVFMVHVVTMHYVKQLIMIACALVYLTLLVIQRYNVNELNHQLNVQVIINVYLDKFVPVIDVYLVVVHHIIVQMNNHASRINVSMLVLFLVHVAKARHVHQQIMSLFAHVQVASVVIQMLNVVKFHPNVEMMMNVVWKKFVSSKNVYLDVKHILIVHMIKHVSMVSVNHHVISVVCVV